MTVIRPVLLSLVAAAFVIASALAHPCHAGELWKEAAVQPPEIQAPQRGSLAGSLAERRWAAGDVGRGSFDLPFPSPLASSCAALPVEVWPTYAPERGLGVWGQGWAQRLDIVRSQSRGSVAYDDTDEFASPWGLLTSGDDGLFYAKGFASGVVARREGDGWRVWDEAGVVFSFAGEAALGGAKGTAVWFLTHVKSPEGQSVDLAYRQAVDSGPILERVSWGLGSTRCARLVFHHTPLEKPVRRYVGGVRADLAHRVVGVDLLFVRDDGQFERAESLELEHSFAKVGPAFFLQAVAKRFLSGALGPATSYTYGRWEDFVSSSVVEENSALVDFMSDASRQYRGSLSPRHVTLFDVDDDGVVDIEVSDDYTTYSLQEGRYLPSPQKRAANPHRACPIRPGTLNRPRPLARMFGRSGDPQVVRLDGFLSSTRVQVCGRDGSLIADQVIPGSWADGPNTRLVDLDRDGRADLIRVGPRQVLTSRNVSGGEKLAFLGRQEQEIFPAIVPDVSWFYDFNGDGVIDLVSLADNGIWVWFGIGDLKFEPQGQRFPLTFNGAPYTRTPNDDFFFVDANHDGMMDLILVRNGQYPTLFMNNGSAFEYFSMPQLEVFAHGAHSLTVADLSGSGASELNFIFAQRPSRLRLDSPETSLLKGIADGSGNRQQLTYTRGTPQPGAGALPVLLEKIDVFTAGQPTHSQRFEYRGGRRDPFSYAFLGYAGVTSTGRGLREELEYTFFQDHPPKVSRQIVSDLLYQSPSRFVTVVSAPATFRGQTYHRTVRQDEGWLDSDGEPTAKISRKFESYAHPGCVLREVKSTPWGELVSEQSVADVAELGPAMHCLFARRSLSGRHDDSTLDFSYSVLRDYDQQGRAVRVSLDGGETVQSLGYDQLGRLTSAWTLGAGTTELTYDRNTNRVASAESPDGVKLVVKSRIEQTGEATAIMSVRGNQTWTQQYTFDHEQRLSSSSDDFRAARLDEALVRHEYRRPDELVPGVVHTAALFDEGRSGHEAVISDGAGRPFGTSFRFRGRWMLPEIALTHPSEGRESLFRTTRPEMGGSPTSWTYADLRTPALLAPRSHVQHDGFGNLIETSQRLSDSGIVENKVWRHAAGVGSLDTQESFLGHEPQVTRRDSEGRISSVVDEEGDTTSARYDAAGRLIEVTFADGTVHRVTYDGVGRQNSSCRDGIGCSKNTFNGASSLVSQISYFDQDGRRVRELNQKFDDFGRIVSQTYRDLSTLTSDADSHYLFFYDGNTPSGETISGQLGHLTGVAGPGYWKLWAYNPDGTLRMREISLDGWRKFGEHLCYWLDGKIRASKRTLFDLQSGKKIASQNLNYGRDDDGRDAYLEVNGVRVFEYLYDEQGMVSQVVAASGDKLSILRETVSGLWSGSELTTMSRHLSFSSSWDDRGNVAHQRLTQGEKVQDRSLEYDARNYLSASSRPREDFHYDETGRRQSRGANNSDLQRDRQARVSSWQGRDFTYGANGQLRFVHLPEGGSCEYVSDEKRERLWHSEPTGERWAYLGSTRIGEQSLIESIVVDGRTVAVAENGDVRLVLTDALSTPVSELGGDLEFTTPFGVKPGPSRGASMVDVSGQVSSCDGTLVSMGKRDYSPYLGEFVTPDEAFFADASLNLTHPKESNLFSFARNNPLKYSDRSGMFVGPAVAVGVEFYVLIAGGVAGGAVIHEMNRQSENDQKLRFLEIMKQTGSPAAQEYASIRLFQHKGGSYDIGDFRDERKINGPGGDKESWRHMVNRDFSQVKYGHTFIKHGQNRSYNLFCEARNTPGSRHVVGQWLDDYAAKKWLDQMSDVINGKEVTVRLPDWVPGRLWTKTGWEKATHATLVPIRGSRRYVTAFPSR